MHSQVSTDKDPADLKPTHRLHLQLPEHRKGQHQYDDVDDEIWQPIAQPKMFEVEAFSRKCKVPHLLNGTADEGDAQ